jgi:hypothetical protein
MDARDTSDFGWTHQQVRGRRDLADLEARVVTRSGAAGMIREGLATTAALTIASPESAAVHVTNRVEGTSAVFALDGTPAEPEGWHVAKAAEIGTLKAANALLARWAADPAPLRAAGLI